MHDKAGSFRLCGKAPYGVGLVIADEKVSLHVLRELRAADDLQPAVASALFELRESPSTLRGDRAGSQLIDATGTVGAEALPPIIKDDSPGVSRPADVVQERIQSLTMRVVAEKTGPE